MAYVVNISEADLSLIRVILMDKDRDAALKFLREKIARPIEQSLNKGLDVSRGRP